MIKNGSSRSTVRQLVFPEGDEKRHPHFSLKKRFTLRNPKIYYGKCMVIYYLSIGFIHVITHINYMNFIVP